MTILVASQKGRTKADVYGGGLWFKGRWRDLIRIGQMCGIIILRLIDTVLGEEEDFEDSLEK